MIKFSLFYTYIYQDLLLILISKLFVLLLFPLLLLDTFYLLMCLHRMGLLPIYLQRQIHFPRPIPLRSKLPSCSRHHSFLFVEVFLDQWILGVLSWMERGSLMISENRKDQIVQAKSSMPQTPNHTLHMESFCRREGRRQVQPEGREKTLKCKGGMGKILFWTLTDFHLKFPLLSL